MKESDIIHCFFPRNSAPTDDCFFSAPDTLITTDSLVEGTHFQHCWSNPRQIAEKLVEVNVSDIAASGGWPTHCLLNLGLSVISKEDKWVKEFSKFFLNRLKRYKMVLVGGDTFFSKTTHLTLTVWGKTENPCRRSGGKNGDFVYLTGQLGKSKLGLHILKNGIPKGKKSFKGALAKHLSPISRINVVPKLQKFKINACMDLTDGIIQDAHRLAMASKGRLEINLNLLPHDKLAKELLGWDGILTSGEELELLFLSPDKIPKEIDGINITKIGQFYASKTEKKVHFLLNESTYSPKISGFLHFEE